MPENWLKNLCSDTWMKESKKKLAYVHIYKDFSLEEVARMFPSPVWTQQTTEWDFFFCTAFK